MTIVVLIAVAGHTVSAAFVTTFYYPLHFPFAFIRLLSWSQFFTWQGDPHRHSCRVWAVKSCLDWVVAVSVDLNHRAW